MSPSKNDCYRKISGLHTLNLEQCYTYDQLLYRAFTLKNEGGLTDYVDPNPMSTIGLQVNARSKAVLSQILSIFKLSYLCFHQNLLVSFETKGFYMNVVE